jgi:hypothetical protein
MGLLGESDELVLPEHIGGCLMSTTTQTDRSTIPDPRQTNLERDWLQRPTEQRNAAPEQISIAGLRAELSQRCEQAGSQSAWARKHGIERSVVSDTLSGRREPSESVVNAMGLIRVVRYVRMRPKT